MSPLECTYCTNYKNGQFEKGLFCFDFHDCRSLICCFGKHHKNFNSSNKSYSLAVNSEEKGFDANIPNLHYQTRELSNTLKAAQAFKTECQKNWSYFEQA